MPPTGRYQRTAWCEEANKLTITVLNMADLQCPVGEYYVRTNV